MGDAFLRAVHLWSKGDEIVFVVVDGAPKAVSAVHSEHFAHAMKQSLSRNSLNLLRHRIRVTLDVIEYMCQERGTLVAMPDNFYGPAVSNQISNLAAHIAKDSVQIPASSGSPQSGKQFLHVAYLFFGERGRIRETG
jgi:hypothetical protein